MQQGYRVRIVSLKDWPKEKDVLIDEAWGKPFRALSPFEMKPEGCRQVVNFLVWVGVDIHEGRTKRLLVRLKKLFLPTLTDLSIMLPFMVMIGEGGGGFFFCAKHDGSAIDYVFPNWEKIRGKLQ